jgi:hypothetical protein
MRWKHIIGWIILTLLLGGLGLAFAFYNLQTALVGLLIYLPLTAVITWFIVFRGRLWAKLGFVGLWLLVFLGWLTYIGPLVAALFEELPKDNF